MGISIKSYLLSFRMERAGFLLEQSNKTITAIAENVGYRNVCNFHKIFKSYFSVTPLQFRKERQ